MRMEVWISKLKKTAKIFSEPLSDSHVEALAALFGWSLTLSTGISGKREGGSLIVSLAGSGSFLSIVLSWVLKKY
jgi:hypothetical protein